MTGKTPKSAQLKQELKKFLPGHVYGLLAKLGGIAEKMNFPAYLAGGIVRDMMLGKKNFDVDMVIEGDGLKFAGRVEKDMGAKTVIYEKFYTAELKFTDGFTVDVATARTEKYRSPAALPEVRKSSIEKDLFRRDFTVNAMALRINGPGFGKLVDCCKGMKDLKSKAIRIIHDRSFIDDPTRIFRALRYEQRYSFKMDGKTEKLLKYAVKNKYIDKLSGYRTRNEIMAILEEKDAVKPLRRMEELGLLKYIHPGLRLSEKALNAIKRQSKAEGEPVKGKEKWFCNLLLLIDDLTIGQKEKLCRKLHFNSYYTKAITNN